MSRTKAERGDSGVLFDAPCGGECDSDSVGVTKAAEGMSVACTCEYCDVGGGEANVASVSI